MHQSWILVAWINDERPSFLLWLRLRRLVVFGEGIWGCSRCNSTMDFFWVVNLPRLHDGQLWRVFSFKYLSMAPCMSLRDFSPLVSLFVFETSGQNFILRTLASSCGAVCFKVYFSKWRDRDNGTSFGGRSFIRCFVERVKRLRMFIHSDIVKVLYCFVWNYQKPGNMYLFEMTMNLLCFVCWCFTGLGIMWILSICWRTNAKILAKMATECWKLLVK